VTFGTLNGSLRVKGRGFNEKRESPVTGVLAEGAFQMLSHATCLSLVGSIEPKPRNPAKAEVFLDDPSESTFAQLVAAFAADAAGEPPGTPVGQSVKITLKVEDGTALLKIKGAVLFDGIGKVAVKAKYAGPVENGSIPELPACM
jgi:hypothetical protein